MTEPTQALDADEAVDERSVRRETRTGWQKATPYITLAVYAVAPALVITLFGRENPQDAVPVVLALIFGTAAIAGLVDGLTFRVNFSLPILAGVGFGIAKILYFNDGTFIYFLACAVIAAVFSWVGGMLSGRKSIGHPDKQREA